MSYLKSWLDFLEDDLDVIRNMTYNRNEFLTSVEHRFVSDQIDTDMLNDSQNWKQFVPHERSGPCDTYTPQSESEPGFDISLYVKMNSNEFHNDLRIYLHEKDKFFYSTRSQYGSLFIDKESFRMAGSANPRAIGKKSSKKRLYPFKFIFLLIFFPIDKYIKYRCQY